MKLLTTIGITFIGIGAYSWWLQRDLDVVYPNWCKNSDWECNQEYLIMAIGVILLILSLRGGSKADK